MKKEIGDGDRDKPSSKCVKVEVKEDIGGGDGDEPSSKRIKVEVKEEPGTASPCRLCLGVLQDEHMKVAMDKVILNQV